MTNDKKNKHQYWIESGLIFLFLVLAFLSILLPLPYPTTILFLLCTAISLVFFAILKHYQKWFSPTEYSPIIRKFLLISINIFLLFFPSTSFYIIILLLLFYIIMGIINYRYNFN